MNTAAAVRTTGAKPITMMKMRYARSSAMARTPHSTALAGTIRLIASYCTCCLCHARCTCQPRMETTAN